MAAASTGGSVKNTKVYGKLLESLDAANGEVEDTEKLTTAELLRRDRAKQDTRLEELRKQAKVARDLVEKREAEEKAEKERQEQEKKEAIERAKREAEEEAIAEMERKTKKFYTLGRFRRRRETGTMYFGDYLSDGKGWVPHGYGEFRQHGDVIYDGELFQGKFQGVSTIKFPSGDTWKGNFFNDQPNGLGLYKFADGKPPRQALYRDSRHVCWLDDLIPGTRIYLHDKTRFFGRNTGTIIAASKKQGKFQVKLDNSNLVVLDLRVENFELISGQPGTAALEITLSEAMDIPIRYDYKKDLAHRQQSTYEENFFHEPIKKVTKVKKEVALTDEQRRRQQQETLKVHLATQAAAKQAKEEIAAALEAERLRKEAEDAERRAYEEELAAQKAALLAKQGKS